MIQPEHIRKKALRLWTSKKILRDWLEPSGLFPFRIAAQAPNGRQISEQYAVVKDWIANLERHTHNTYIVEYCNTNHRQLGTQKIPSHIVLETRECCLRLIGKQRLFDQFKAIAETTLPS